MEKSAGNVDDDNGEGRATPSLDRLIAEIMDRAREISLEGGSADCMPFSNWLQAEDEIRRKYRLSTQHGQEDKDC